MDLVQAQWWRSAVNNGGAISLLTLEIVQISAVGATSAATDIDNATAYATINANGVVTFR